MFLVIYECIKNIVVIDAVASADVLYCAFQICLDSYFQRVVDHWQ